jgi:23S rRNA pseudouridine1911/1915/1917 synthase
VVEGAPIEWDPNRPARSRVRCQLPILYEDPHLLIVDKPAGLLTVPTAAHATGEDTALQRVREYVRRLRPRQPYVGRVHRIDRDTSGAVAFALDARTRRALIELFRRHEVERAYVAVVSGQPRDDRGTIDLPISELYEGGRRHVASRGKGREAVTRFEVRTRLPGASLLSLRLTTGRQHQIRLHLAHIGHPVLGDRVYGGANPRGRAKRLMLHAETLGFVHPWTGEPVRACSPPPPELMHALREHGRGGKPTPPPRSPGGTRRERG